MHTHAGILPRVNPDLRELFSAADLIIGNCEGTLSQTSVGALWLVHRERMSRRFLSGLLDEFGTPAERWVLSVANNHSGDRGAGGFAETIETLQEIGIGVAGTAEDGSPHAWAANVGELRLGIVGWSHWMNVEAFAPGRGPARTRDVLEFDWRHTRNQLGLDCLIATPHWDREFHHFPQSATRRFAADLVRHGFDLIAGHHPHVLQPLEMIDGRPCLYSLGTFCGPSIPLSWPMRLSAILEIRILEDSTKRGSISSYVVHPVAQINGGSRPELVPLEDCPERLRSRLRRRLGRLFEVTAGLSENSPRSRATP